MQTISTISIAIPPAMSINVCLSKPKKPEVVIVVVDVISVISLTERVSKLLNN